MFCKCLTFLILYNDQVYKSISTHFVVEGHGALRALVRFVIYMKLAVFPVLGVLWKLLRADLTLEGTLRTSY